VVLVAVLVGAALPVLVQLYSTLRAAQDLIRRTGGGLERTLDATARAAERLDGIATALDRRRVLALLDAVDGLASALMQLRDSARVSAAVASAIAPAVAAAVRAWRSAQPAAGADGPPRDGSSAQVPAPLDREEEETKP
jgi:hypothetical protein